MAKDSPEETPSSASAGGTTQARTGVVAWRCNCGTTTLATPSLERRGWYVVNTHPMPADSPGQGRPCAAPAARYGNPKHLVGSVVDHAADRAATWRVIGIEPEEAERNNCWQAPSVGSVLDRLRAIETAATAYRDAVVTKRAVEAQASVDR